MRNFIAERLTQMSLINLLMKITKCHSSERPTLNFISCHYFLLLFLLWQHCRVLKIDLHRCRRGIYQFPGSFCRFFNYADKKINAFERDEKNATKQDCEVKCNYLKN